MSLCGTVRSVSRIASVVVLPVPCWLIYCLIFLSLLQCSGCADCIAGKSAATATLHEDQANALVEAVAVFRIREDTQTLLPKPRKHA